MTMQKLRVNWWFPETGQQAGKERTISAHYITGGQEQWPHSVVTADDNDEPDISNGVCVFAYKCACVCVWVLDLSLIGVS